MHRRTGRLFVSHAAERCGIHQYGRTVFDAIRASTRYDIEYAEIASPLRPRI